MPMRGSNMPLFITAHDHGADHRASDPANAAIGGSAADEAGGDDIELEPRPALGVAVLSRAAKHETREGCQRSHVDEGQEGELFGLDARQFCRLGVAADRIDLPTDDRFAASQTHRGRSAPS